MAAKFSMANPAGLFGQEAHVEAADRLQGAVEDLRVRSERTAAAESREQQQQAARRTEQEARAQRSAEAATANAQLRDVAFVKSSNGGVEDDEDDDDDALLDELENDPELER